MSINAPNLVRSAAIAAMVALAAGCGDNTTYDDDNAARDPVMAQRIADYPLDTCVVTGNELGSMGEPYDALHEEQLVRFCCSSCIKEFNVDPDGYMAKIHEAKATSDTQD